MDFGSLDSLGLRGVWDFGSLGFRELGAFRLGAALSGSGIGSKSWLRSRPYSHPVA